MKKLRFLFIALCFLTVFCFRADSAFAFNFNFYYQEVEEVYDPADTAPSIGWGESFVNWLNGQKVEIKKSETGKVAYKIKTTRIYTRAGLLSAMGVTEEDYKNNTISNKQKALIDSFDIATNPDKNLLAERAENAYRKKCDVYLIDSSDFDSTYGESTKKDFWPLSWGEKIQLGTCYVSETDNADILPSTLVHEYSHTLDKTKNTDPKPYGLDGSHRMNEIISKSAAFKEAWAEYNEMIEYDSRRDTYMLKTFATSSLVIEDPNKEGDYSNTLLASNATAEQLLCNEMFMARMLYELHELLKEDSNGKDIVSKIFYETNSENNSMSNVIKQALKDYPDKATEIYKIVDNVTLNKMTDDELIDFCGKSEELSEYLATRNGGTAAEEEVAASPESTKSEVKAKLPINKFLEKLLKKHNLEKEIFYDPKEISIIKSNDGKEETDSESVTIKKSEESTNPFQ